jgi:hypothetical protein
MTDMTKKHSNFQICKASLNLLDTPSPLTPTLFPSKICVFVALSYQASSAGKIYLHKLSPGSLCALRDGIDCTLGSNIDIGSKTGTMIRAILVLFTVQNSTELECIGHWKGRTCITIHTYHTN